MKFKNILTGEEVEAKSITEMYAFSHNSNYKKLEEEKTTKKPVKTKDNEEK